MINFFKKIFYSVKHVSLTKIAIETGTDKWGDHYYTPHYQVHFEKFRLRNINLLEIGVGGYDNPHKGGESLRMWKKYFPFGSIFSLDIFDKSGLEENRIKIFKGSQSDEKKLKEVANEIGEIDIIIDDGSHVNSDVITSFKTLFPKLKKGGIYVIEDTQTSYWPMYGGGFDGKETTLNLCKRLTDCLNYKEFPIRNYEANYFDEHITSMHFYHNLVFIYKGVNDEKSNLMRNGEINIEPDKESNKTPEFVKN